MTITFSKALQKYYTRKGNRIIFSNGMTLNQLAWEMWERLGYQEIDPSVLSRVLGGKRMFTTRQLAVFCRILRVDKGTLEELMLDQLAKKYKLTLPHNYIIDWLEDLLTKTRYIRDQDIFPTYWQWGTQLRDKILVELGLKKSGSSRRKFLSLLTEADLEIMYCIHVTKPKESLLSAFLPYYQEAKATVAQLRDKKLDAMVDFYLGDIYYVLKNYKKAIPLLERGAILKPNEGESRYVFLRPLATVFSAAGMGAEFKNIRRQLSLQLPKLNYDLQASALDGIARGEGELGLKRDYTKTKEKEQTILNKLYKEKGKTRFIKKVQSVYTELRVADNVSLRSKNEFFRLGEEALLIAEDHGIVRVGMAIKQRLEEMS